jgi:hypothetical protein
LISRLSGELDSQNIPAEDGRGITIEIVRVPTPLPKPAGQVIKALPAPAEAHASRS